MPCLSYLSGGLYSDSLSQVCLPSVSALLSLFSATLNQLCLLALLRLVCIQLSISQDRSCKCHAFCNTLLPARHSWMLSQVQPRTYL